MKAIPRDSAFDGTLAFLRGGYRFISERCDRLGSDVFETRLALRKVYCARGASAAQMFYTPGRFTRKGAIPPTVLLLLQDVGSVQSLDGAAHAHRKALFMSLMSPDAIARLVTFYSEAWDQAQRRWEAQEAIVLHPAVQEILCRAVCRWSGLPLKEDEAPRRTREFAAMIDGAGAFGPRNWRGLVLRHRTERWARAIMEQVRSGALQVPAGTAVHAIANHRDEEGNPLDTKVAAVELLNVLRPTVAVARFVTFAALALHQHPETRAAVETGENEALEHFAQEVRRFYPFFPAVGGKALEPFHWEGYRFEEGAWILLDLYGTNHDARSWKDPHLFRPERFRDWNGDPYDLIPQGAGDVNVTHRCPGERITLEVMKQSLRLLVSGPGYVVPEQDLSINYRRFPTLPASGFRLRLAGSSHTLRG